MKVDRKILAGSAPANLNLGLCHVTFEQRQTQGRVLSGEPPNGMSTKYMGRRGRNTYVSRAEVVA
jgi:hypothetical protein